MTTQYTRQIAEKGIHKAQRNMTNGKPYRLKAEKARARANAEKCRDGAYRSSVPVQFHPVARSAA